MRRRGFTLVELMIVMVIIGILITFILRASMAGIRRAEEKATIALVAKLEQAMTDRVDALTTYQADPTPAHYALAAIYPAAGGRIESVQRAQVIAQFDYLRAQLPDVFVTQVGNLNYPINFAGAQFGPTTNPVELAFQLPIGNSVNAMVGGWNIGSWNGSANTFNPGTGIYGAAYEIAAGIYGQFGYSPKWTDGSDNDGDGLVDEMDEALTTAEQATVAAKLGRHTHKTARAEMLYAILVEGGGTYGSSFDKDDFTSREVQDTDGDGLMEFVDAWGEPLQFYRWPTLYRSDSQKGYPDVATLMAQRLASQRNGPYMSVYEAREQNPLDPNQTLVSPAWWGYQFNSKTPYGSWMMNVSASARTFMTHFGLCLVEPMAFTSGNPSPATFWDRSSVSSPPSTGSLFYRRAYYSRFLILSGGPDKEPGTAMLGVNYLAKDDRATIETPNGTFNGPGALTGNARDASGGGVAIDPADVNIVEKLLIESQGGKVDPSRSVLGRLTTYGGSGRNDTNSQLEYYSQDDISSQNLQGTGGVLQ